MTTIVACVCNSAPVTTPAPKKLKYDLPVWGWILVAAAILTAVWVYSLARGGLSTGGSASNDVQLSSCGWDGFAAKAEVQVTNSGSDTASYTVTVEFDTTGGTQVGTGTAYIQDLAPGQSGIQTALAPTQYGAISCSVKSVDRT